MLHSAFLLLALSGFQADQTPAWLLVRSNSNDVGGIAWEKLRELYTVGPCSIVRAQQAEQSPNSNRLVIGTPATNELVAELAPQLGLQFRPDGQGFAYAGINYGPNAGIVIVTDDPDRGGRLALFAGGTDAGVFACLTTTISTDRLGVTIVPKPHSGPDERLDRSEVRLLRLDLELLRLFDESQSSKGRERALRVARGMLGYSELLGAAGNDLLPHFEGLLAAENTLREAPSLIRQQLLKNSSLLESLPPGDDPIECAIRTGWARMSAAHESDPKTQPVFLPILGSAAGTNARTFGPDPVTGRPRIVLNLNALSEGRRFELAVLHESAHVLSPARTSDDLLSRAISEGIATELSLLLATQSKPSEALFWSPREFAAAQGLQKEIDAAFRAKASSTSSEDRAAFLQLGGRIAAVPGAPSRCGYWVAWRAVRAWRSKHPAASPADLTRVRPDQFLAALAGS